MSESGVPMPRKGILDAMSRRSIWVMNMAAALILLIASTIGYFWPIGTQRFNREDLPSIADGHIAKPFVEFRADVVTCELNHGFFGIRDPVLDGQMAAYVDTSGGLRKVLLCHFVDGVLFGKLRQWSAETGQLIRETEYIGEGGSPTVSKKWYDNGVRKSFSNYNSEGLHDEFKVWSRDGELIMHSKRINGKLETLHSNPPPEDMPEWFNEGLILRSEDGPPE